MSRLPGAARQPVVAIASPVAVVHHVTPLPPPSHRGGVNALVDLERESFPPGTAANGQFQCLLVPWGAACLAINVFPGGHLALFAETLRKHGLALHRGNPCAPATEAFDVRQCVARALDLDVEDRIYLFAARVPGATEPAPR